jgi:hypothetical protein
MGRFLANVERPKFTGQELQSHVATELEVFGLLKMR